MASVDMQSFVHSRNYKLAKPVFDLAQFFGFTPKLRLTRWTKILYIILLSVIDVIMIGVLYYRSYYMLQVFSKVQTSLRTLFGLCFVVYVNLTILNTRFFKAYQMEHFLVIIVNLPTYTREKKSTIWIQLVVIHIMFIVYVLCFELTLNRLHGPILVISDASVWVVFYSAGIGMFSTVRYVVLLKSKFLFINKTLKEEIPLLRVKKLLQIKNLEHSCSKIFAMRESYMELNKAVRLFNDVFGWNILTWYAGVGVAIVDVVDAFIESLAENLEEPKYSTLDYSVFGVGITLWWSIVVMMGVVVAVTCDMTTREAQRTANICYNLLLNVPTASTSLQDNVLREELTLLAQQATHQCPYFSAAGFFNVDYTMLFGLLGSVTSYVIVVLQINK